MKHYLSLFTVAIAMFFGGCNYDHEIMDLEDRLDRLEGSSLTTIEKQMTDINSSLDTLKATAADLQSKIDATNAALAALESDLEGQITASEQKVLNELNTVKTALEGQLATINNTIATLTSQLTAIEDKITSIETAVAACATPEELDAVEQDLATLQTDMAAMITAITALQTKMATVEGDVDSLQTAVADLESRIAALEDNFVNRIQSLTFLPRYSDGKVKMDYKSKSTTLDFIVSPAALAHTIETAFNEESSTIKAFVSYTEDPTTRATLGPIQQIVEKIEVVGNDGMFTLTIKEQGLDNEFWQGMKEAVIYIHISTGSSNFVSNTIPMIAHSYVGDTNNINSFGDGTDWRVHFTE